MTSSLIAGLFQLFVPSYAFRLVRRFGAQRVGWFIVTAFVSLALLHLFGPQKAVGTALASGLALDAVYIIGSVLLLIGMGHVETLFSERERAAWSEQDLQQRWEAYVQEQSADLVRTNEELVQEVARLGLIQKTLEESEAQFRFLFTENPQPMWIFDLRTGRFLTVNRAALEQYGFTAEEFMTLTVQDLLPPGAADGLLEDAASPCPNAQPRGTWQHCRKDKSLIDVEITALDLTYANSQARLVLATDISQRQQRELEARKSLRTETINQIIGGVAHHFNNLLTVIDDETSILCDNPQNLKSAEQLEHISEAVARASGLARQLLMASGQHPVQLKTVDLNRSIWRINPILQRLVGDRIAFENNCGLHQLPILADPHLIEQSVINLVLNARDAMPDGGTLVINAATVRVNDAFVQSNPQARTGAFVCLTISDTGCGISPDAQAHVFEPFFTTRTSGKATGLGLASVYGAVKQQSGWIELSTAPEAGTEFRIYLPCAPEESATRTQTEFQPAKPQIRATILLVEPDDRVRGTARCVLNWNGFRVIEADTSSTALILWEGQASDVDLLVTEISLPDNLSGPDLANQLRQAKPGLKVIYTSHYDPGCRRTKPRAAGKT